MGLKEIDYIIFIDKQLLKLKTCMKMYEKNWISSNELKYSFTKYVNKMASSYKTVHYIILPLESVSLYCSTRIKLGAAVW